MCKTIFLALATVSLAFGQHKHENMRPPLSNPTQNTYRYMPLGDSYTICEGAKWEESWPYLLTNNLLKKGVNITLVGNPSVTGYTTQHLIEEELPLFEKSNIHFTTLLIGVNDYVQGRTTEEFKENLSFVIDRIQHVLPNKSLLILITIPDYSVTPGGAQYARGRNVTLDLTAYNEIIKQEGYARKLPVVDIFPSTLKMKGDPSLIAADGLHPSAKEYANWEPLILEAALKLLQPSY